MSIGTSLQVTHITAPDKARNFYLSLQGSETHSFYAMRDRFPYRNFHHPYTNDFRFTLAADAASTHADAAVAQW